MADGLHTPINTRSPLGRPVFPLISGTSRYRVISVSFYCGHTEPQAPSCPVCFALSEDTFNCILVPSDWALCSLERFQSVPHAFASVRYRNALEAPSYQNPHRSNQLWQGFCVDLTLYSWLGRLRRLPTVFDPPAGFSQLHCPCLYLLLCYTVNVIRYNRKSLGAPLVHKILIQIILISVHCANS
jgi:hypothetical protein